MRRSYRLVISIALEADDPFADRNVAEYTTTFCFTGEADDIEPYVNYKVSQATKYFDDSLTSYKLAEYERVRNAPTLTQVHHPDPASTFTPQPPTHNG